MIQRMQKKLTAVLLIIVLTLSTLPGMAQEVWADSEGAELYMSTSTTHVFGSVTEGYAVQPPHQVNLENTGNTATGDLSIALSGANPEAFSLNKDSIPDLAAGGKGDFQIQPVTGLSANTYTATVTVSGSGVTGKSFDVSFLVSPAGTTYTATIKTYIDDTRSDVTGSVELWKNNKSAADAEWFETGGYTASVPNGDYWVYINGVDTGRSISINGGPLTVEVDYYTVSFSSITAGTADESIVVATANGTAISSGTLVLKNSRVDITAKGKGAASYSYAWNDAGSTTTAALSIAFLKSELDVVCTVTGVGDPPSEPDYDINGDGYQWTGNSEKIVLSGESDTLTIHKAPTNYIKLEIASEDGSTVTIIGNSIDCNRMNLIVLNDIALTLENINVTAPPIADNPDWLARIALLLNKAEKDSEPMIINVIGNCFLSGSEAGHGIASIQDQNLRITGTGTLNANGGDRTSGTGDGGSGIVVNTYTYGTETGAKLTIDGGVTVNAAGGDSQSYAGGLGIDVAWGNLTIRDAAVSAIGGQSTGTSSGGTAIRASYGAPTPLKGGNITVQDSEITAQGGNSVSGYGGRGIDAFGALSISGSSIIDADGGNSNSGVGGTALYGNLGEFNIHSGTINATGGNSDSGSGGTALYANIGELNIHGGTINATGGHSSSGAGGTALSTNLGELNIHSGTIHATGGNSAFSSGSPALYAYLDNLSISGGTITAKGGNGEVNGSHAIYSHCGAVTIGSGANVTSVGGDGNTGVGGVGIRAYGASGGTGSSPGTVQIAANAGDIYVRGGQGVSALRDSIIGRSIYVATGNIGSISMELGATHVIQNVPGGDDLYHVKAAVNPAAKVVIQSSVYGSKGYYLYRAPTKEDGLASLWLPAGEKTLMAEDYDAGTLTVPVGGSTIPEITLSRGAKDPVVTAHNTAELKTYMSASYVTTINLVEGTVYDYDGASITRTLTINGNGATINAGAGIDGIVVKMTDGKVPNAEGKVFLEVQGAGSSLTLKDVTIQGGSTLFLCGINAKTGAVVSLEEVTFKGFHANIASEGKVNNFGVHAEPEASALTVKNCMFDSSNAFRNAVAVRGGTALIENSTFIGTETPELLNVSDGYEYGVYLYGGTSTVRNNTMSGYDGALIPGYLSSPIATAAYYDIAAEITGNKLSYSTVGINLVGAWHTLSYPCKAMVNGIALNSSENAYLLGEKLTSQNTIANNMEGSIQLNLDQNDYYTDTTVTPPENFGTPVYFGGFLKLKEKSKSSATLEFLDSKTAKAAIANRKSMILQVSGDNGASWTTAAVTAPLTSNSTGAVVSLASGKTYLLRTAMTITSQTMPHGSLPDVYTSADIVCYSNAVSVTIAAGGSSPGKQSTPAANNGADVIVNGKIQNAGSAETIKGSDGRTTTTVTVDSAKLEAILDAEKKGATVVIPVTGGADTAAGKLTGEMIKNMENQEATLVLKTDAASYTLPASQINISDVSRQIGTGVSLSDIAVSVRVSEPDKAMAKVVESAASNGGYTIMVPAVDFTITCTYGGRTVNVSGFNSYVERTIAIPDGVDPKKITTGVVVDPKGIVYHVPTRVTVINGTYYAVINSLTNSIYSVIWNPIEFADVKKHWAKDTVNNMGSRMVVTGVGNSNYAPARNLTRGEFAAILVRALGLEPGIGNRIFGDVTEADWYSGYIKTAAEYGIITGYDNGNFGPDDTITREQAMAMIARTMKITGINSGLDTGEKGQLLKGFTDAAKVSSYARDSIEACLKTGIITGVSADKLSPKTDITRAEAAVLAERLLQKSNLI